MMTMQEFYERAMRRVDARDEGKPQDLTASRYLEVECSLKRGQAALYQISDLAGPEHNRIIRGVSPEECLRLWDAINITPTWEAAQEEQLAPSPSIVRATHLGNGGVQ